MPLPLPNLDTKRYAELLAEAQASIPALAPAWTDHNPSDPGITLVELFAWLTESVLYRTNQSPDEVRRVLLTLLRGPGWPLPDNLDLEQAVFDTISALRRPERVVTASDYEEMVLRQVPGVARVKCVPERSLVSLAGDTPAPGYVSVIVLKKEDHPGSEDDLLKDVRQALHEQRLLTTRLEVVGPPTLEIPLKATLVAKVGFAPESVAADVLGGLIARFDSLIGGPDGLGWPFGKDVYVSEIHAVLDEVPGVDYVEALDVSPDPVLQRLLENGDGEVVGVKLLPHELVDLQVTMDDLTVL